MGKILLMLFCWLLAIPSFAGEKSVRIENCRPGSLEKRISREGCYLSEVEKLTISGKINIEDILTIVHKMEQLRVLDMENAGIAAGTYTLPVAGRKTIRKSKANELTFGLQIVDVFPGGEENPKKLERIVLPGNLEKLDDGVFSRNKERYGLLSGEIRLPSKLKYIGRNVFAETDISYAVPLPESLEYIGSGRVLSEGILQLPSGLSYLNAVQFDCPYVTDFALSDKNREYSVEDGVLFNKDRSVLVAYPKGRQGKYVVPSSVKEIGEAAFCNSVGLTEVELNDRLQTIGARAFDGCDQLKVVKSNGNKELSGKLRREYDFIVE